MMPSYFRTLRFRIAAAFFAWTGLIQLLLVLVLPIAREAMVYREMDARLERAGEMLVDAVERDGRPPEDLAQAVGFGDLDPSAVQLSVRAPDGRILAHAGKQADDIPFSTRQGHTTVTLKPAAGESERMRVSNFEAHRRGGGAEYIQLSVSLRPSDRISSALRGTLWLGLVLGLAGAAGAGWVVSGLVTSRIDRIARAVRSVSPTRLDERIDLPAGTDEIGRMAADVNKMLERMAVAFRSQERFMSEVSHELKTPLSALLTEAQVLKRMRSPRMSAGSPGTNGSLLSAEAAKAQNEPYDRFVLSVEEEMRWLGKLVESFLMLARFGHGKQFVAETIVPVNDVVLDAVEHSTLYARQHGVNLSLRLHDPGDASPEALVRGDPELLRVVADNLIRNAVQFSKRGDTVQITVDKETATSEPPMLVVTVKDQGPGVPEEYLQRIFDRFAQAPGKQSTRRGSGLGLTIAKGVVDLHGGTIDARNAAEGGCIFRVRLPWHRPAAVRPAERARADVFTT